MPGPDPLGDDSAGEDRRATATEIVDEMHDDVDRFGDRSGDLQRARAAIGERDRGEALDPRERDPRHDLDRDRVADHDADLADEIAGEIDEDEDEVWFEAEALAAASTIVLGAELASTPEPLRRAPTLAALAAGLAEPGISLARLPGWPGADPAGQGLGPEAEALLGELRPGDLVLVSAAARGVGRTSLLAQLGDGLALADELGRPSTPVVFVSAEPPASWRARSLGRYFGVDPRVFVPGHGRIRSDIDRDVDDLLAQFAAGPWAELDERQRFAAGDLVGARADELRASVRRWQAEAGGGCWPIVIVDPVLEGERARVADTLAELASLAADEGWIVLASADLPSELEPALARRLDACASVRLAATAIAEDRLSLRLCHRRLGPRGTLGLRWDRVSGRFSPQ